MTTTNKSPHRGAMDSGGVKTQPAKPADDTGYSGPPITQFDDTGQVRQRVDMLQQQSNPLSREYYDVLRWLVDTVGMMETRMDEQDIMIGNLRAALAGHQSTVASIESDITELTESVAEVQSEYKKQHSKLDITTLDFIYRAVMLTGIAFALITGLFIGLSYGLFSVSLVLALAAGFFYWGYRRGLRPIYVR